MIPEAAVEAAAKVISEVPEEFANAGKKYRAAVRANARAALEAAAPHMLAEAMAQEYEAGADALGDGIPIYASNLRARAASIRAKEVTAHGND